MSIAPTTAALVLPRRVTWATVDDGFHVASRAGEFVGCVDTTRGGGFVAFDGNSSPIGRFSTLREAQSAVAGWRSPSARADEARAERTLESVATVTAAVAAVIALAGGLIVQMIP